MADPSRPGGAPAPTGALATRSWPDVGSPVVVVAVGSFEQHGPHLPLDTDTRIAAALAEALVAADPRCVVGPTIAVTASGEHAGFPGTLSIGTDTTAAVLVELARSAGWAAGIVFVNGHGGNGAARARAEAAWRAERRRVLWWSPRIPGGDLHAGRTETSLLLHLWPETVQLDRVASGPQPSLAELVTHGVQALSPTGVLGDPARATASEGADLFARLRTDLIDAVDEWLSP